MDKATKSDIAEKETTSEVTTSKITPWVFSKKSQNAEKTGALTKTVPYAQAQEKFLTDDT
jgi:hypothetical protein